MKIKIVLLKIGHLFFFIMAAAQFILAAPVALLIIYFGLEKKNITQFLGPELLFLSLLGISFFIAKDLEKRYLKTSLKKLTPKWVYLLLVSLILIAIIMTRLWS